MTTYDELIRNGESFLYSQSSLQHHGIKGQKWGVRRFQNPDGTLTAAGRRRAAKNGEYDEYLEKKIKETMKKRPDLDKQSAAELALRKEANKAGSDIDDEEVKAMGKMFAGYVAGAATMVIGAATGADIAIGAGYAVACGSLIVNSVGSISRGIKNTKVARALEDKHNDYGISSNNVTVRKV